MADNVIGIQFGVAGGSSIGGESGRRIKAELEALSEQIQLQVNIDQNHFAKQLTTLKAELEKKLGELKITIKTSEVTATQGKGGTSSDGTGSTNSQTAAYSNLQKQLESLAVAESRLAKLEKDKGVSYEITKQKVQDLRQAYIASRLEGMESGDITQEQSQRLNEYAKELEKAIQLEKERDNSAKTEAEAKEVSRLEMSYAKLQRNAASLYTDGGFDKVIARSKEAREAVDAFNQKVKDLAQFDADGNIIGFKGTTEDVKALNKEFIETQANLKRIQKETDTLGNKLLDTFASKLLQTIAYSVISAAEQSLKKLYENVVELDKAITNLQIASGKTRDETEKLIKTYSKLASQLGATTIEVAESADTWLRQGYSVEDANAMITNSMVLSKLGQLESAEAARALTSAVKGYKVEIANASLIVDKFTAVDMEAAASAGDIATAMAETATSADIAGVSMDKLIGYIATVKEVTQDGAESVGTFYKTLFARMNNVAAGNFIDAETGESLNDVETVLNNLGIALRDVNGVFRNSGVVLDEVAGKWNSFDNVQQHAIATAFAGTRQQEKFIVLMENYGSAMQYAETATNSAGTAMEKFGAYTDSIEGKMNALQASYENFSATVLDSDLITGVVDLLTGIINVLNAVMGFADGFVVKALMVIAILALLQKGFSSVFGKAAIKTFGDFVAAIQLGAGSIGTALMSLAKNPMIYISALIAAFSVLSKDMPEISAVVCVAVLAIGTAVAVACKMANNAVWTFMESNPLGWILLAITAVVLAITSIIKAIDKFNNRTTQAKEDAIEAFDEINDKLEETRSELEEVNGQIDELTERIEQLYKAQQSGEITLVEQDELSRLETELAMLEEKKALLESLEAAQKQANADAAADVVSTTFNEIVKRKDAIGLDGKNINEEFFGNEMYGKQTAETWLNYIIENWDIATEEAKTYASSTMQSLLQYVDDLEVGSAEYNKVWEYIDKYRLTSAGLGDVWNGLISRERFRGAANALKDLAAAGEVSVESLKAIYASNPNVAEFIDYLENIGAFSWNDADAVNALANQVELLAENTKKLTARSFSDILEELEGGYDILKSAIDDIESIGIIGADTIKTLISDFPELTKYLIMTANGYRLVDGALDDFLNTLEQKYVVNLLSATEGTEEYAKAYEELTYFVIARSTKEMEEAIRKETDALNEQKDGLKDQLDAYKALIDIRKDLLSAYQDEVNYQRELEKKQRNVSRLQQQLSVARLDNSAAGQARVRELEAQLQEAQDDLDDFTLEHAIDILTNQLDSQYVQYETQINAKIDEITNAINDVKNAITSEFGTLTDKVDDVIAKQKEDAATQAKVRENQGKAKIDALIKEAQDYVTSHGMLESDKARWGQDSGYKSILDRISSARSEYGLQDYRADYKIQGVVPKAEPVSDPTLFDRDTGIDIGGIKLSKEEYQKHTRKDSKGNTYIDLHAIRSWNYPYENIWAKFNEGYSMSASGDGYEIDIHSFKPVYQFHSGGIVGGKAQLANNEVFAKLLRGELVSTPEQVRNFMEKTLPAIANYSSSGGNEFNAPLIEIKCDSVTTEAMPELKSVVNEAVKEIQKQLDGGMSRTGYKRSVKKL